MCFIFRLKKSEDAEERVIPLTALPFPFDIECVIWISKVVHGYYYLWMYILESLVSPSLCTIHKKSQPYFSYRPLWSVERYMGEIPFAFCFSSFEYFAQTLFLLKKSLEFCPQSQMVNSSGL